MCLHQLLPGNWSKQCPLLPLLPAGYRLTTQLISQSQFMTGCLLPIISSWHQASWGWLSGVFFFCFTTEPLQSWALCNILSEEGTGLSHIYYLSHLLLDCLQDKFLYVGQRPLASLWSAKVHGPFWRYGRFCTGTALWPRTLKGFCWGFSLLRRAYIPWLLNAPQFLIRLPSLLPFSVSVRQRQTKSSSPDGFHLLQRQGVSDLLLL